MQERNGSRIDKSAKFKDEFYTNNYGLAKAEEWMDNAKRFIFLGTSFSVNITAMALDKAIKKRVAIDVIDPEPINLNLPNVKYHKMTALEYINNLSAGS